MKKVCVRVSVETEGQLWAALEAERTDLIYIDSGTFAPGEWKDICGRIHERGMETGLRLPFIFRKRAEDFFDAHLKELSEAGFDRMLCRNLESVGYFFQNVASCYYQSGKTGTDLHAMLEQAGEMLDLFLFGVLRQPGCPADPLQPGDGPDPAGSGGAA